MNNICKPKITAKPFFSIVTCTKNSEKFLQENIDSVRGQTMTDYEHIFIDGFSTDNTLKIIKDYQVKNKSRVRLYKSPPKGISNAFNKGVLKGKGHWIVFLNSDDRLYDRRVLSTVYSYLSKNSRIKLVWGKSVNLTESATGKSERIIPGRKIFQKLGFWRMLLFNDYIPHQSVYMNRELFLKYGIFNERLDIAMDYEMWLRLSKGNVSNGFIDRKLSVYRYRKLSDKRLYEVLNEYNKVFNLHIKNPFTRLMLIKFDAFKLNLQKLLVR
ncbi:MAG: cell wall biogenesis glycosyltransferase [uncultured bacterium]|nr:MAG: cell wall biogenesis glycosyltransferase [uncultured bacterium]